MSTDETDFDGLLPVAHADIVTHEMTGPRALKDFTLGTPARYKYYERGRERYGWFRDPSAEEGEVVGVDLSARFGRRYWYILLRHGRAGWRVDKAIPCDSLESARTIAGMEWASREGWLLKVVDGRPVVGPKTWQLADPVRYLDLIKTTSDRPTSSMDRATRRRRGGDGSADDASAD